MDAENLSRRELEPAAPAFGLARLGEVVDRPRLIGLFRLDAPLTVLRAPVGTGKTVAALQWAHALAGDGVDVRWVDGSRHTASDLEAATARPEQDRSPRRVVVVDDADQLDWTDHDVVHMLLRDHDLAMVLCARTRLPWFSTAETRLDVTRIEMADLRLTVDEILEVAAQVDQHPSRASAEAMHTAVSGWPSLVRLGLVRPEPGVTGAAWWSPGRIRAFVRDQVRAGVVDQGDLRNLRRAAFVEHLDTHTLRAVSPDGTATSMLASLERLGVVDRWADGVEPVYWMAGLQREILRNDFADVDIGPIDTLHDAVIAELGRRGLHHLALVQAVRGSRWDGVAQILEHHGWELLRAHEQPLRGALRELPDHVRQSSSHVRALEDAVALRPPRSLDARTGEWLEVLDDTTSRLHLKTISLVAGRRAGKARELVASSSHLVPIAESALEAHGELHVVASQFLVELGITLFAAGDLVSAEARLRRVVGAEGGHDELSAQHEAASFLALISVLVGELEAARSWRDRAHELRTSVASFDFTTAAIDLADVLISFETPFAGAHHELSIRLTGMPEVLRIWSAYAECRRALTRGGRLESLDRLRAARAAEVSRLPDTESTLSAFEADVLLSLGRGTEASEQLARVDEGSLLGALVRARLEHLAGHHDRAIDLLAALTQGAHPFRRLRIEAQLLEALSHHRSKRPNLSRGLLSRAVDAALRMGLVSPFTTVPDDFLRVYDPSVAGLHEVLVRASALDIQYPYPEVVDVVLLTPRERDVLEGLARGESIEQIAARLFVSRNTVKTQSRSLYRKLGVANRSEAVATGHQLGLLHD